MSTKKGRTLGMRLEKDNLGMRLEIRKEPGNETRDEEGAWE